jgi:adenine-specific DNA methylase
VADVLPEGFLEELTPKEGEVVANPARQEDPDKEYERLLRESFEAMREVLSEDGRLTVMFTHPKLRAWHTLVRTLRDAGFRVNMAWPVWTEAQWSLHQREKAAVRYTLILACEPREGDGKEAWWSEVRDEVRERVEEAVERAERQGLEGVDKLVVAYGAALSAYTGYERVLDEETGEEVEPELVLDEARRVVADLELEELEAGGLDEEGRFYVLYRAFYGYPSKSGAPDWDEVRRLGLVLGVDPEDLGYVERHRGRAYLRSFEDREKEELSPDGSSVDVLHLALHRLDEGREAVQEVVEEADGVVELARACPDYESLVQAIYQKEMTPLEGAEKLFAGMGVDQNLLAGGNYAEKN